MRRLSDAQISSRTVQPVLAFADAHELARSRLLARAGLEERDVADKDTSVPVQAIETLWSALAEQTPIRPLGLAVAEHVRREHFDLIHFLGASSRNFGDAVRLFAESFQLLDSRGSCLPHGGSVQLATSARDAGWEEFVLAAIVRGFQSITRAPWVPSRVSLRSESTAENAAYEEFFGCSVSFDAEVTAFMFEPSLLDAETASPDELLHAILLRQLEMMSQRAAGSASCAIEAEKVIARELSGGQVTIDSVARALGMSRRTLQRRLDEEGVSFSGLVEDLRKRLAAVYLAERKVSVAEIARLLGYSDASAFRRSSKNWNRKG